MGTGGATAAVADDRALLRVADALPAVEAAARDARSGSPDAVQRLYDRARDAAEDIRAAAPVSASCRELWHVAGAVTLGHIRTAEGVDRLSPGAATQGRRAAAAAGRRLAGARRGCRPATAQQPVSVPQLANPHSGEAVFGGVLARAPSGTFTAELRVDSVGGNRTPVLERDVVLASEVAFGRRDLTASFFGKESRHLGTATSEGVWGLPASAGAATDGATRDGALSARLERAARGFPGYSAAWIQDLASGRTAGHNADARFPRRRR